MAITELTPEDWIEIQMLYNQYAVAVDLGDAEGRSATFTADGRIAHSGTNHEWQDMEEMRRATPIEGGHGRRHLTFSLVLKATEEGADGVAFLLKLEKGTGDGAVRGATMVYNDSLVRTRKGWRFKTRHVWPDRQEVSPFYDDGRPLPPLPLPFGSVGDR